MYQGVECAPNRQILFYQGENMRRRSFEKVNLKLVSIIAIIIFFFTISIGYSLLRQKLNIFGKATIVEQRINGYIKGKSYYNYQILNTEKNETNNYTVYDVKIIVTNLDDDITSWKVEFDAPQGCNELESSSVSNSQIEIKNGRVALSPNTSNGYVSKGSNLELEIKIAIFGEGEFSINNLTLNDRLASNKR